MFDIEAAEQILSLVSPLLNKYYVSEPHIALIYKLTARLGRFPYAKAIECALIDDDNKNRYYAKYLSCIYQDSGNLEWEDLKDEHFRGYNRIKARFDRFTAEINNILPMGEIYKNMSQDQINSEEHTHFSDAFIKQIKYRLLHACFSPGQNHQFGYADWIYKVDGADIFYYIDPNGDKSYPTIYTKYLDAYMDEHKLKKLSVKELADALKECQILDGNKEDRIKIVRELIEDYAFKSFAIKEKRTWYVLRSNIQWPNV